MGAVRRFCRRPGCLPLEHQEDSWYRYILNKRQRGAYLRVSRSTIKNMENRKVILTFSHQQAKRAETNPQEGIDILGWP